MSEVKIGQKIKLIKPHYSENSFLKLNEIYTVHYIWANGCFSLRTMSDKIVLSPNGTLLQIKPKYLISFELSDYNYTINDCLDFIKQLEFKL